MSAQDPALASESVPASEKGNAAFVARARQYLEAVLSTDANRSRDPDEGIFQLVPSAIFRLIPPLALGQGSVDTAPLPDALERIAERRDCADFVLAGMQRILLRYANNPLLTPDVRESMEGAVRHFCYWYDQPGIAGMCFHTENHQILFHSCEILAGQMFPDLVFPNSGLTGAEHAAHGTARALGWMDQRARFGFVEWLSCYFEEDLLALLNLYDFAENPIVRTRAQMLIDMILFEIALYGHRGVLGTTHGRTYAEYIKGGRQDPVSAISYLVFGQGVPCDRPNLALTALGTSLYRCPQLIQEIAADVGERVCRARCGLSVAEAAGWGLRPDALADQMFFWSCQTARHPLSRPTARQLAQDAHDDWLLDFIDTVDAPLAATRDLVESGGANFDGDAVNTALAPADLYVLHTPDYVLSCAQDFRPGRPGYQQHIWQATLNVDAVVFTNHPGAEGESSAHTARPNFWAGNRFLPRAAQWRNVVVCLHHVPADDPFPFSHAYFPQDAFEEIRTVGNWVFGRAGNSYVALYSQHKARWMPNAIELRADAPDNAWICEMGAAERWETFDRFCATISAARVHTDGLKVEYDSPSIGALRWEWTGGLTVGDDEIPLHDYPRYENPYCFAEIGARRLVLEHSGATHVWDFT